MTKRFDCDGPDCSKVLGRDEARIAVTYVEARKPQQVEFDPDEEMPVFELDVSFDAFEGNLHFCSNACLIMYGWKRREDADG